jgi:hypothetical protein
VMGSHDISLTTTFCSDGDSTAMGSPHQRFW